jgi:hypothetical protein
MISRRILVISRSPALSRAVQAALGPGYQVVTSTNVTDVVEEANEQGPSTSWLPARSSTATPA